MNELVSYKSSLCSLKGLLGLGCFHFLEKEELLPYVSKIIETLNTWLIMEDKHSQQENVKLFIGYFEDGLDKLVGDINGLVEDYGYSEDDPDFIQRYFVASWTNVYTTIYLELLYNYPELFTTSPIDCHECCGSVSEDSNGVLTYLPGNGDLSAPFIGSCGCGK